MMMQLAMNNSARFASIKNAIYWHKIIDACDIMLEMICSYKKNRCYDSPDAAAFLLYVKAFELCGEKIDRIIRRNHIVVEGLLDTMTEEELIHQKVVFVRRVAVKKKDMC
jgi:hypothetical protein